MNRRSFLVSSFLLGVMHATGIKPEAKPLIYNMGGTIMVYSRSLTQDELDRVNNWINWKYREPWESQAIAP